MKELNAALVPVLARQWGLTRPLQPGDTLILDTEECTVTLNGEPLADYQGLFFEIVPEVTTLFYRDHNSTRKLQMTVQYTEQYL